jgi:outer membrane protein assembly factor BamA
MLGNRTRIQYACLTVLVLLAFGSVTMAGHSVSHRYASIAGPCDDECATAVDGWDDDSFYFSYNRVDGVVLGLKKSPISYRRHGTMQLYGKAALSTKSKRFIYHAVLERSFFPVDARFAIGIESYDLTYTEDRWIIPETENMLAALLIHEDFHDFYQRKGYGFYISQNLTRHLRLRAGYYEEEHRSLDVLSEWSLFGGKKRFRPNPPVEEATFKGFVGRLCFDTRNRRHAPRRGWLVQAIAEYFREDMDNALAYQRYILDIRRYQPISRGENLNFRLRIGETSGRVPVQKYFDIGGISTLRAYDYKAFTGTRMVLANLEYAINWDRLDWYPDIPFIDWFDLFNLVLFVDAGAAWPRQELRFQDLTPSDLRADVGIAFANDDGTVRLNIAKRTDRSVDAIRITFRISRPF